MASSFWNKGRAYHLRRMEGRTDCPALPGNVRRAKQARGFSASLSRRGFTKSLGTFDTAARAHMAVRLAEHWLKRGVRIEDIPQKVTWRDL